MHSTASSPTISPRVPAAAALLALLLFATACHRVVIPEQSTVTEQFEYANKLYRDFKNPVYHKRQEVLARETVAAFQKVIDRYPGETAFVGRSRLAIAYVHKARGKTAKALALFKELPDAYPGDDLVVCHSWFEIGSLYDTLGTQSGNLGKHEQAKVYYKKVIDAYGDTTNPEFRQLVSASQSFFNKPWSK